MVKTLPVHESTWKRLRKLMREEKAESFDEIINRLIDRSEQHPETMFGIEPRLKIKLTQEEHGRFTADTH